MTGTQPQKGKLGEDVAADFLRAQGLTVVARNVRCALGEIDLVARHGSTHVFVEVKSRSSTAHGLPQEAITRAKQRRMTRLAQWYIKQHRLQHQSARFDIIAIIWRGDEPQIQWIPNAFEAAT